MHKKLTLLCMAIAAVAAFVAPSASAANLTENGVTVNAGALIKGTNTTPTKFTAGELTVECTHAELRGKVIKDENGTIEGTIAEGAFGVNYTFSGTGSGGDCTSGLGPVRPTVNGELCLHVAKGSDVITTTGCAGKPISFTLHLTSFGVSCTYGAASVAGNIKTGSSEANVVEGPATRTAGGFLCPTEGKLDLNFDLYTQSDTTNSNPLIWS